MFEEIPTGTLCVKCNKRSATEVWSEGIMAAVHGGFQYRCEVCCLEEQLAFAQECVKNIKLLERKLARARRDPPPKMTKDVETYKELVNMRIDDEIAAEIEYYRKDLEDLVKGRLINVHAKFKPITEILGLLPVGVEVLMANPWSFETSMHIAAILKMNLVLSI